MRKPIIFLDIETTGTDVVNDRIVQLAILKSVDLVSDEEKNVLINPGKPIPKEATEVHGISDDMVKDQPLFSNYAKSLFEFIKDCDYAGFNIIQFDVPLLSEEFARVGIEWPHRDAVFYDAFHVFREKEKRDLSGAVKFYCNEEHTEAHDALSDIKATKKVMEAQMKVYADVEDYEKYGAFCKNSNALDLAGKIVLNEAGEAVFSFGKHKGKSVRLNPGFGRWMLKESFPTNTKKVVESLINSK